MSAPVKLAEARKRKERQEYAALVLKAWDDLEHQDKREFLERRSDVERAGRERL